MEREPEANEMAVADHLRTIAWEPIGVFDPKVCRSSYLFTDGANIILGHWYEGEREPRMAYTGGEFPIFPTHWALLPAPPPLSGQEG